MCEPAHSIVQYPDHDVDDDAPFSGQLTMGQRLNSALGKAVSWGKKIRKWFHFSKLGAGHSDAIELSGHASLILPEHTRYEGLWWDREFIIDGPYHGVSIDKRAAIECAEQYHKNVVMGNMSTFRRFLEKSLQKTDRYGSYVIRLSENVLTKKATDEMHKKLKRVLGTVSFGSWGSTSLKPEKKGIATDIIMGFTRKRELFLPHWADDDKLWLPAKE